MPAQEKNPSLKKLEETLAAAGYQVRYEKGSFRPGYCLLQRRRVVVVNKFLTPQGRAQCLLDLLPALGLDAGSLSAAARLPRVSPQNPPA